MSCCGPGSLRGRLSTVAGESGQKYVLTPGRFCISAEGEAFQRDSGSRRLWDQLQHRAVVEFRESTFGAGTVCADADEYCWAAGMHTGRVDPRKRFRVLHHAGTEQLCGEQVLPPGARAGLEPRCSANAADGNRAEYWLLRRQGRSIGYPACTEPDS